MCIWYKAGGREGEQGERADIGAIMRLAPGGDACRLLAAYLVGALSGVTKEDLLELGGWIADALQEAPALSPKIAAVVDGIVAVRKPPEIRGTGYVVDSLEAALWAFANSESVEEGH